LIAFASGLAAESPGDVPDAAVASQFSVTSS
jgi:hypothetical protein